MGSSKEVRFQSTHMSSDESHIKTHLTYEWEGRHFVSDVGVGEGITIDCLMHSVIHLTTLSCPGQQSQY